jgi:hypothetical protein
LAKIKQNPPEAHSASKALQAITGPRGVRPLVQQVILAAKAVGGWSWATVKRSKRFTCKSLWDTVNLTHALGQ